MSLDSLKQEATNHNTSPQRLRELAAINDELTRLVAANPSADSSLLGELAIKARTNKDVKIQRAIASNPNTPTQWLIGLAYLFPEEFFSNPVYNLLILENVNFIDRFGNKSLLKLVSASNAPTSFLELAAGISETNPKRIRNEKYFGQFPGILNIIANHPKTPKTVLDNLAKNSLSFIAEAAKLHINFAGELSTGWRELASSKIDRAQLSISTHNEEAIELRLWYAGAIHESSLPYLNQKLVQEYPSTLLKIICSAETDRTILDNLENHPRVSQLITECITLLKQRETIFFDLLPRMLPIDNTELLNHAGNQINPVVTDLETLFTNLNDKYWCKKVRYISLKTANIYVHLVELMHGTMGARSRGYYLQEMLTDLERGRYKDHHPLFIRFSNLEYYGVILASDPSTSPQILSRLVEHLIPGVRVLVASHHNITQNSLDKLIDDRNPEVRAAALANPKLDSTLREQLASLENPNLSSLDLLEIASSKHTAVRAKVVRHPNVDGSILAKLADDKLILKGNREQGTGNREIPIIKIRGFVQSVHFFLVALSARKKIFLFFFINKFRGLYPGSSPKGRRCANGANFFSVPC